MPHRIILVSWVLADEEQFAVLRKRPQLVVHHFLEFVDGFAQRVKALGYLMVCKGSLVLTFDGVGGLAGLLHLLGLDTHFLHILVDTLEDTHLGTAAAMAAGMMWLMAMRTITRDSIWTFLT